GAGLEGCCRECGHGLQAFVGRYLENIRTYAVGVLAGATGPREPSFSTHLWRQSRHRWVEKERGSLEGKALQTSQPRNSYYRSGSPRTRADRSHPALAVGSRYARGPAA